MKKIIKWIKRILLSIFSLLLIFILGSWVSFNYWKKDLINDLPKNSLILNTKKGPIEYSTKGSSNKYILLVHGSPGSVHSEDSQIFTDNGFNVISISRPGYYETPLSSGKTPKEQAALYKALLDELSIDSVYVNAISGGGPSAIQFALDYPEKCAGLILRAAVSKKIVTNEEKGFLVKLVETEFVTWTAIQIALTQVDSELKKGIIWYLKRSMFPKENSNDGFKNDIHQFNVLEEFPLEKITVPTMLFHGNIDNNVPFSYSLKASKRIPNATLFEMNEKTHYAFFGPYSKTINNEIILFLNSLEN